MTTPPTPSMTVEEARAVYWLKNNHRPLGELLDEGYLNERRLAWAAEKAYNPELKAAAAVLLAHTRGAARTTTEDPPGGDAPLALSITEAEARATVWPFPPRKGRPMGELSDAHEIGLKDLGYAVDNAWDRRVRDAAILLMAQRLRQAVAEPTDASGPPAVVSGGRSFSRRRELIWVMVFGGIMGWVILAVVFGSFFSVRSFINIRSRPVPEVIANPTPASWVAMAIVILGTLGAGLLINKGLDWAITDVERRIHAHRRGYEGEERVLDAVRQNLDGEWTIFTSVTLPTRKGGDMDMVLVGPSGVWVLEVKNFQGRYRNYGEHWDYRAGKGWQSLGKRSPSRQARDNAVHLSNFLRADGLRQYVEPAVVWANEETEPEVDQPVVPVWTPERLPDELGNLDRGRRLDDAQRTQIVEKLTALCERQSDEGKASGAVVLSL